jgi:protein involved in polysaccharide export with SLBB domain
MKLEGRRLRAKRLRRCNHLAEHWHQRYHLEVLYHEEFCVAIGITGFCDSDGVKAVERLVDFPIWFATGPRGAFSARWRRACGCARAIPDSCRWNLHVFAGSKESTWRVLGIWRWGILPLVLSLPVALWSQATLGGDLLQGNNPEGAQNGADCSDPLMATTAQCFGLGQEGMNGLAFPQTRSTLGGGNTVSPLLENYYDLEEPTQPKATGVQPEEVKLAPQPLTEFQKFVAATTAQILPIYGENLFRSVPSTFAPLNMAPVPPDYVIGPGDELRIRVWGQINTQVNVRVDRSGDIYVPQVGPIHVAGLPFSALDAHLQEAVGRVFKNFDLTVDVGQIRAIQVYVTGEARRPGVYTVSSLSTLVNALFASGGPSVEGSLRRIELRRSGSVVTTFDFYALLIDGDKSRDVKLLDGDVIFIPPVGAQAAVTGSVHNAGIYELRNGETLGQLLADAGGVSEVAAQARISIERVDEHRNRYAMEVNYDAAGLASRVADGDLMRVFPIVPMYLKTVTLRGNTVNPGRFAWRAGMRISDLIPDKDSLLTRNYWWRRTQLGLPAPEFEPVPSLAYLHQPPGEYAIPVPAAAFRSGTATENQSGGQENQAAMQPEEAATPESLSGTESASSAEQQNPPLNAQQRASETSLAAAEANTSNQEAGFPAPRTDVKLPAPDIDWGYAVIERLDPETLKTKLIPFDLGKLVIQHDVSQNLELEAGDIVTIFSQADVRVPITEQTKLVRLEGEFVHSGVYSAGPGETLRQLVQRAGGFSSNAYLYGSEFTRESTRVMQQARIDEYVQSMNLSIQRGALQLAAGPVASARDVASSTVAGAMEQGLLASLRQIRATGRIVLQFKPGSASVDSVPDITLENGDQFTVPPAPSDVNVVGAVYDQNSFLYKQGLRAGAYLHLAGGLNKDADRKHEFLIRADGEVISYSMSKGLWGNEFDDLHMNPGDTIVVPDKTVKPSAMRGLLDWTEIFSQYALPFAAFAAIAPGVVP